jgi:hypothetical protein
MKPVIASALLAALLVLPFAGDAQAARVRVVHTRHVTRVHVTVHAGFPIRRTFPEVVVREGVVVRVAPRVYLAPVTFAAVAIAVPARQAWRSSEALTLEDGWTDFTMNVNRRGSGLVLQVEPGAAQISFAEVVFENGETQVVDFNDAVHRTGAYNLLDFRDGRTVDHVRVVAKADTVATNVTVHLIG